MSDSNRKRESPNEAEAPSETTPRGDGETPAREALDAAQGDVAEAVPAARKPRRQRHRKRAAEVQYDAQGRERPRFLLGFPRDPELDELVRAFEGGNYARVRRDAPRLAERTTDARVRAAARELRRRIDPDPALRYVLLTALALLAVLVYWAYGHSGH
jgi:hypothetical protein